MRKSIASDRCAQLRDAIQRVLSTLLRQNRRLFLQPLTRPLHTAPAPSSDAHSICQDRARDNAEETISPRGERWLITHPGKCAD